MNSQWHIVAMALCCYLLQACGPQPASQLKQDAEPVVQRMHSGLDSLAASLSAAAIMQAEMERDKAFWPAYPQAVAARQDSLLRNYTHTVQAMLALQPGMRQLNNRAEELLGETDAALRSGTSLQPDSVDKWQQELEHLPKAFATRMDTLRSLVKFYKGYAAAFNYHADTARKGLVARAQAGTQP